MKNGSVFDAGARSYYRDDEHWGSDLDVLKAAYESAHGTTNRTVRHLDIGCGPGFHIEMMKRFYPSASIEGIDSSARMLQEARKRFTHSKLIEADILDFEAGCGSYDVVSYLNNGFGNVHRPDRDASTCRVNIISKMRGLLRKDGHIVMSVYNRKKFVPRYGRKFTVLEKSNLEYGDFFVEYRPRKGAVVEYYSHWFMPDDVVHLLERVGLTVELLEERMARIVVLARLVEGTGAT